MIDGKEHVQEYSVDFLALDPVFGNDTTVSALDIASLLWCEA